MAYEMRAGSGSLFKNDYKEKETQPDLKGKVMLPNGEVRWLSAWKKTTGAGAAWLSISVGELVQAGAGGGGGQNLPGNGVPAFGSVPQHSADKANAFVVETDDDIPF